ncbi:hypothetical protein CAPTEDRAFT_209509 [Capitella teleta]|uniref:Uncharacterized protein n=1 Tax=Capitella teleta TaxID=283909 RepID=R7TEY9_CAPTE|nr:hypothetical protein CAPTEDRAFT_209509 [Capitella teleta]|eukprot:ELT92299.1 hypothetical protein CAPTEDRAFT_209509 [Capitella teleta]
MDSLIRDYQARKASESIVNLDTRVPHLVIFPKDKWVEHLKESKDEFDVDGAYAVFLTWNVEIAEGRRPYLANLASIKDGELNCVAQRVIDHYKGVLRGQGLTPARRMNIQEWEVKVRETGATVADVTQLESMLCRAIILRDIAGEDIIYNSGKYQKRGNRKYGKVDLFVHNGHAWSKDLKFPQTR